MISLMIILVTIIVAIALAFVPNPFIFRTKLNVIGALMIAFIISLIGFGPFLLLVVGGYIWLAYAENRDSKKEAV